MTAYKDISFLFEKTTEQVYIVNLPLIRARSERFRSPDTATSDESVMLWLQVDGGKPLIVSCTSPPHGATYNDPIIRQPADMPRSLRTRIDRQIAQDWQIPLEGAYEFCPEDTFQGQIRMTIDPKDLPALSAWMLEYPVGYTFSEDAIQKTNLDGEPLVLVKVKVLEEEELGDRWELCPLFWNRGANHVVYASAMTFWRSLIQRHCWKTQWWKRWTTTQKNQLQSPRGRRCAGSYRIFLQCYRSGTRGV